MTSVVQSQNTKNSANKTFCDVEEAKRVIRIEAEALNALMETIPEGFKSAIEILIATQGRVVITGMGKSGHVGSKLAATLSSTGTPSYFVHPGEASHGDLGMLLKGDVLIALSNSGETSELSDILAYAKRVAIPLIGITARAKSTLSEMADVALVLPAYEEACPMGLAPTTSTTLMMALGDALAMALLARRGFSANDFSVLHPGGKLGQILMRVEKIMHKGRAIPLVSQNAPFGDVLLEMTSKAFGCTGVIDDEKRLVGVITDGDLRRHLGENLLQESAQGLMTTTPLTIGPGKMVTEALTLMNSKEVTSLFVCDADKKLLGILHLHDCLRAGVR